MEKINDLIDKARKLKHEENFKAALDLLVKLFEKEPNSEDVKFALIDVLISYGGYLNDDFVMEYEKATSCFTRVLEIEPKNYRAYYNLGLVNFNLGKIEQALEMCNKALELKPDYKYCYYSIGLIYETMNDLNTALKYYERALKIDKNFVYASQALNIIKQKLNRSEEDFSEFEKRKSLIEKLKSLLKMSKRIEIQMIQDVLKINKTKLLDLLIEWGGKFKFEIDGDYLIVNKKKLPALFTFLDDNMEMFD